MTCTEHAAIGNLRRVARLEAQPYCLSTKKMRIAGPILSALLLHLILMCGIVFSSDHNQEEVTELVEALTKFSARNEADVISVVANAEKSEQAVIFIHVGWAFMEPHRTRFADFAMTYHKAPTVGFVLFHYADCTPVSDHYRPLRSIKGWRELEEARDGLVHAEGEVVWLQNGRVLHAQRIEDFETTTDLLKRTESLFTKATNGEND